MIYLDNAATEQTKKEVLDAMMPYLKDMFYNPSASYEEAQTCMEAVEKARKQVADLINAEPDEIYFTSGGSESDNWAVKGSLINEYVADSLMPQRFITTTIEHKAIQNSVSYLLTNTNSDIIRIPVRKDGRIKGVDLSYTFIDCLDYSVNLYSIMMANNEIGVINDIEGICHQCHLFNNNIVHTDAVQAFGHIPIDVKKLGVDMLSASGHKIGAPKGIGILYISNNIQELVNHNGVKFKISPLIHGGSQERGMRGGTYNVPSIVGLGKACEIAKENLANGSLEKTTGLRDHMIEGLYKIPDVTLNGSLANRLPGNINIRFKGIKAEELLTILNQRGILCSTGSACNSDSGEPSYVLKAIGLTDEEANSSLRFSLSENNTKDEIDEAVKIITKEVERLRSRND